MRPLIVGVAGGSASGKTSVCEMIFQRIGGLEDCTIITLDSFYRELS